MTENEAIELLKYHSNTHDDISHVKSEKGFLGMLRPFKGELREDNFHELMTILKVLRNSFNEENINKQVISSFWGICHFSRAWAIEKDGMLRSNNLISDNQIEQLTLWVNCISYAVMNLLDNGDDAVAFEEYNLYLSKGSQ